MARVVGLLPLVPMCHGDVLGKVTRQATNVPPAEFNNIAVDPISLHSCGSSFSPSDTVSFSLPRFDQLLWATISPHLCSHSLFTSTMTRTHKTGDRDHVGLANGTAAPEEHLPRYFGKAGFTDNGPNLTKKQGGGKGNWGLPGMSELEDFAYNPTKPRRRTNSFSAAAGHSALKTKWEHVDADDMVEYEAFLHGPTPSLDEEHDIALEKSMTVSSEGGSLGSVEEEGHDATIDGKSAE